MPSFIPISDSSNSAADGRSCNCCADSQYTYRNELLKHVARRTMDLPVVNQIFRQLFAPSRQCLGSQAFVRLRKTPREQQRRTYALRRSQDDGQGGSRWQQRIDAFPKDMSKQLREYPKVTANDLRHRTQRPRRVKMLAREFIEGWTRCMYYYCIPLTRGRQSIQSELRIFCPTRHDL